MKYDDASWHYGGDFPEDLPIEAGATHTGMFLAWAVLHDLASEDHYAAFASEVPKLKARELTPGQYLSLDYAHERHAYPGHADTQPPNRRALPNSGAASGSAERHAE